MFDKYENIINPATNRKVSIYSKKGMNIVKNYLNELYGGTPWLPEELDPNRFGPQVRPVALQGFKGYQDREREERMKQVNAERALAERVEETLRRGEKVLAAEAERTQAAEQLRDELEAERERDRERDRIASGISLPMRPQYRPRQSRGWVRTPTLPAQDRSGLPVYPDPNPHMPQIVNPTHSTARTSRRPKLSDPVISPYRPQVIPPFHDRPDPHVRPATPSTPHRPPTPSQAEAARAAAVRDWHRQRPKKNVINWQELPGLSKEHCRVSRRGRCVLARTPAGKKGTKLLDKSHCKLYENEDGRQLCGADTLHDHLQKYIDKNKIDSDVHIPKRAQARVQAKARNSGPVEICKRCKFHPLNCYCYKGEE